MIARPPAGAQLGAVIHSGGKQERRPDSRENAPSEDNEPGEKLISIARLGESVASRHRVRPPRSSDLLFRWRAADGQQVPVSSCAPDAPQVEPSGRTEAKTRQMPNRAPTKSAAVIGGRHLKRPSATTKKNLAGGRSSKARAVNLAAALLLLSVQLANSRADEHEAARHNYDARADLSDKEARLFQVAAELMGAASATEVSWPRREQEQEPPNKSRAATSSSERPSNASQSESTTEPPRAGQTTTQVASSSTPLNADLLHDHNHETDKLSHLGAQKQRTRARPPARSSAKLDATGWLPAGRDARRELPGQLGAQQAHKSHHNSHSSSLQPKHVPPPVSPPPPPLEQAGQRGAPFSGQPLASLLEPAADLWPQREETGASFSPPAASLELPPRYLSAAVGHHFVPLQQLRPTASEPAGQQSRAPLLAKAKGIGHLLPRLAAKLFSGPQQPTEGLHKQHSHLFASHNAPTEKQKPSLVKSLLGQSVGGGGGHLQLAAKFRPLAQLATQTESPAQQLQRPNSRLVFLNGQLYSVLDEDQRGRPESSATPTFDHQTSETSDFPIFEAMSKAASQAERAASWQAVGPQTRCDRPRHIIQADRSVVSHILASEQNFVIARVPIRKLVRVSTPAPSPSPQQHLGFMGGGQQVGWPSAASSGTLAPSSQQFVSMANGALLTAGSSALQQQPSQAALELPPNSASTTIELLPAGQRVGLLASLAALIGNLRRRPQVAAALVQQPGVQMAASKQPAGVFLALESPLMLAHRADRWRAPTLRAKLAANTRRMGRTLKEPTPIWDHSALAASLMGEHLARSAHELQTAASSQQRAADPMRRLLMLKTASEHEVCSPIDDLGAKIKYSCVPNSCVVAALSSAARGLGLSQASGPQRHLFATEQLYKMSNTVERPERQGARVPPVRVTYTHLNAYAPPPATRLAQPQHQQFVSSTRLLNELAQQDAQSVDFNGRQLAGDGQQQNHVTFGTAFVRTSATPAGLTRARSPMQTSEFQSAADNSDEANSSFHTDEADGPNEFLSAVDEQLERPIRLAAAVDTPPQPSREAVNEHAGNANERAQNLYHVSENRKLNRVAPRPPMESVDYVNRRLEPVDEQADVDVEAPDEDEQEKAAVRSSADLSRPFAAGSLDQHSSGSSERQLANNKFRRHFEAPTTSRAPLRYGQRQSRGPPPPPPPEKPAVGESLGAGPNDEDAPSSPSTSAAPECDCSSAKPDELPPSPPPDVQQATNSSRRAPTTSARPTPKAQEPAKDRRQTQRAQLDALVTRQPQLEAGHLFASSRRPYNLRNTTYKNLQLVAHNNELRAIQLAPLVGEANATSTSRPAGFAPGEAQLRPTYDEEEEEEEEEAEDKKDHKSDRQKPNWRTSAESKFTPASVNDILAVARLERPGALVAELPLDRQASEQGGQQELKRPRRRRRKSQRAAVAAVGQPADKKDERNDHDDDHDDGTTPHQYQIQLRWAGPREQPAGASDQMGERVRDRLFEHREEEHWHEKKWRRANSQASATDPTKPAPLVRAHQLDLGPHQRATPIGNQLANEADQQATRAHFAVPTRNFRQPAAFVAWAQRDIDLSEWPGEPRVRAPTGARD